MGPASETRGGCGARMAGVALLVLAGPVGALQDEPPAHGPSFVLILADDMGWGDLGCQGSAVQESPRLDRLAAEGARFTDAYASAPNCSPSRAALLTGRSPARIGLTTFLNEIELPSALLREPEQPRGLPLAELTLAELLGPRGYATGFLGKWHLGDGEFLPEHQGFEVAVRGPELRKRYGANASELTTHEAQAAVSFLEEQRERPFLLFLALHAVHPPTRPPEDLRAKYAERPGGERGDHAALVEDVDRAVGRILDALERLGRAGDTYVVFTSDNGAPDGRGDNGPFRGGKDLLTEGGLRVPLLVRGPAVRPGTVVTTPVDGTDLVPTVLELAGAPVPAERPLDGRSLVPALRGEELPARNLFWHFPHYSRGDSGGAPSAAVRSGPYKLLVAYETGADELHDLRSDAGELVDVADAHRALVRELRDDLTRWRERVGARMPEPNPDHDPLRANRRVVPEKVRKRNERNRRQGEEEDD